MASGSPRGPWVKGPNHAIPTYVCCVPFEEVCRLLVRSSTRGLVLNFVYAPSHRRNGPDSPVYWALHLQKCPPIQVMLWICLELSERWNRGICLIIDTICVSRWEFCWCQLMFDKKKVAVFIQAGYLSRMLLQLAKTWIKLITINRLAPGDAYMRHGTLIWFRWWIGVWTTPIHYLN